MATFELARNTHVNADPARVHALIDDFHHWESWSPWEELDPDMEHRYSGPDRGVGARQEWSGNKKVGEGSMEITESDPAKVVSDLEFIKPFRAQNVSRFDLAPDNGGTKVTWTMTGKQNPVMRLMGRLYFDKAVAKDFDRGLGRLKAEAEAERR